MIATVFEMSYPNQTIIVSLMSAATLAVVTSVVTSWQRSREKKLDWDREDRKEKEKERKADEVAERLLKSNKEVAHTAAVTNGKLNVIHTLVNSNMTAAMRNELEATIRELALMRQIVERDKADGRTILPESIAAIESTDNKIKELTASLRDRLEQTAIAEKQASEGKDPEFTTPVPHIRYKGE